MTQHGTEGARKIGRTPIRTRSGSAEHAVVVVGAGPTGMMLAAELVLAGVDAVVVERRATPELDGSRAGGLHSRTIEVLDQRGVAERFLEAGQAVQVQSFAMIPLDIGDFPTRHPYGLALWQRDVERILAGWIDELGVRVLRGHAVVGLRQDHDGVDLELADGSALRCAYVVGCDGGRSVVRSGAGIGFSGWDPTTTSLVAEAEISAETPHGVHRDRRGQHGIHRMDDGDRVRIVVAEEAGEVGGEPTIDDLRRAMAAVWDTDFGVQAPSWISRFTDMTRQADDYRSGRVLLAGDAAHVHYPVSGQGLNIGVQDAVNLGWKLAQVVAGTSPDELLDTYHSERHPVAARVLQSTMAQTVLARSDPRRDALRETLTDLLGIDEARRRVAGMISGLDVRYDLGDGHPVVGWRAPDLDLRTAAGPTRVAELLREARPLLLALSEGGGDVAVGSGSFGSGRVRRVDAGCDDAWELPVVGRVPAPDAVVIRPDGYVAWAGDVADPLLPEVLSRWFGR